MRTLRHLLVAGLLAIQLLLWTACEQASNDSKRAAFARNTLATLDLGEVIAWARQALATGSSIGSILAPTNYPPTLSQHPPIVAQIASDTSADNRCVILLYTMGPMREGIMIGTAAFSPGPRGYRYRITNGVYYVLDYN